MTQQTINKLRHRRFSSAMLLLWFAQILAIATTTYAGLAEHSCFSSLNFTSEQGHLYVNGIQFKLKGVSWFGFETRNNVVHGLWKQRYTDLLDFLSGNGFNAIRLPFHLELALKDGRPVDVSRELNPDLYGLSSLRVMDKIVKAAASRGLLIMLDLHSFKGNSFIEDNMWYNLYHPESKVLEGWGAMARRYASHWNVIAADLKNEPYGCTWGTGNPHTDWNLGAATLGNYLHRNGAPHWLIFVEGVAQGCTDPCFWGEHINGAKEKPVLLTNKKKLVYSPHVYGPGVNSNPYFNHSSFPSNMPAIWDAHFGTVADATGNAVVIGEWGGTYQGADQTWMNAFVDYMLSKGRTDQFFWCLNPNSDDTGGLLMLDWSTPDTDKLSLLQRLCPLPTRFFRTVQGQYCVITDGSAIPSVSPSRTPSTSLSASGPPSISQSRSLSPSTSLTPSAPPSISQSRSLSPSTSLSPSNTPSPSTSVTPLPTLSTNIKFHLSSSGWWFAVTIAGSTSVKMNCGNGEGWQDMQPGWMPNQWTFAATGAPCGKIIKFKVNEGPEEYAQMSA